MVCDYLVCEQFTQREATYIFVRTNLGDELFGGPDHAAEGSEAVVTADEFDQMVARVAREKVRVTVCATQRCHRVRAPHMA